MTIRLAIIGFGKIAQDQHLPAIQTNTDFELVAIASPGATHSNVPVFEDLETLLASEMALDAVVLCTPPQIRRAQASRALEAGLHVFLEKPPGASVAELAGLTQLSAENNTTLFASWHSRFAAAVAPAREWLADSVITSMDIIWKEDVRDWHPGQQWIWAAGGLGVFDPGINALSIATEIMPHGLFVTHATLQFPDNCQTPIAAEVGLSDGSDTPMHLALDWRQPGPPTCTIDIQTDKGHLQIADGGKTLRIDDVIQVQDDDIEYAGLYAHFAELIAHGRSDHDFLPFQLAADAFLLGQREVVASFYDDPDTGDTGDA